MSTSTNKSLWTLISGSVMQTNPEVLDDEIESSKELISNGLLYYKPNTPESAKKYASSKASSENIRNLVNKLSKLLGVEESICSDILCSYLVTEFRGTMESLKVLLKEEQNTKPLLLDIWQYYRAERLYLLQIIKHVLAGQSDYNDESDLDLSKMAKLLDSGQMNKLLLDQINSVTKEKKPNTEGLGTGLGKNCSALWIHFNLREISELLQILLLSLSVNGFDKTDIINITDAFYQFGFGNKLSMKMEFNESNSQLVKSISYLSIMNLVYLLDLPTLTVSTEDHKIWGNAETVTKMERLISGLGSSPLDSPALLTWTLSCYLAKGSEGLGKSTRMGEVAVANRVLKHFENILSADFMHHSVVADIIHMQVFSVLSVLLTVFDPTSMGMDFDLASLAVSLLKHEPAAEQLWSQEPDTGLRLFVTEQLQNFPNNFLTVVDTMTSLASGCQLSCCNIVASLASLHLYSERVDGINIRIGENADGTVQLLEDRYPYMSTKSIHIPAGTRGELLESGCVRWRMKINGWQILLAECSELNMELLTGEEQIKTERLNRVTRIANLVANILKVCPEKSKVLDGIINELEIVCGRLCQVAQPPVHLLAGILQTLAYLAKADGPSRPVASLAATGLLPHFSLSHSLLVKSSATLDPGLVGHLLAGEETVSGDYPLLLAFLNFMKETCQTKESLPGILLICREILPGLSNWRYQNPGDREHILKLSLATLLAFINNVKEGCELLAPETNVTSALLNLVSTGDRTIQTMLEGQVSWEKGRGTDFCQIIHYALQILHRKLINLLISPASSLILSGPVGVALRSPPSGHQPHLVLSLAQYTFFFHDPLLVTAAVNMLAAIARAAAVAEESVSMLACLGNSAVSVKERLVNRLESSLEDIRLKIAIVNLLSECIVGQPGMIQLLLDININIVVSESKVTDKEHSKPQLIGEGCLEPALGLLALCKERKGDNWDKLHLSLVKLIYRLWDSASLLATRHLKDTPEFWINLCWPLYDVRKDSGIGHTELKAYILRILASEVYTWKGKVAPELNKVLEKICNEKSDSMKTWCNGSITESGDKAIERTAINDTLDLEKIDPEDAELFLQSSWKIFLLVLTKDLPSSFSPAACNLTFTVTIKRLINVLREEPPPVRLTLLLAETAVTLNRRWQTKCTSNMDELCKDMANILETLCSAWPCIHPRTRKIMDLKIAIIALALSILRCSQFKLDVADEPTLLGTWLSPVVRILGLSFREAESQLAVGNQNSMDLQISELVLSLLQTLISRFTQDRSWLTELHHEASLQLLLGAASTCCKHKVAAHFVRKVFQLLLEIAASQSGTASLLCHELAQLIWLPLSDLPTTAEWHSVTLLGVEFASIILRTGRTHALKTSITAMALLSDKLVNSLVRFKTDITFLSDVVTIARFISLLSSHVSLWRSEHMPSLLVMYRCSCALIHHCSALLMRPTYLGSLLKVSQGSGSEEDTARCRKVSTASVPEVELESLPPEAVTAQSQLLDTALSCLSLLLALSPPLSGLLKGDVMLDPGQWEPLLSLSFANPNLEEVQEESSYGTLLALANTCVRGLTRDHARSPSPGRAALGTPTLGSRSAQLSIDTPEKRQLHVVLEKTITLILSQSIFTLSHSNLAQRDKQLLKREIGAELGSITDTWKRQYSRGGKSPATSRSARSPAPSKSPQPPPSPSPQPGQKAGRQDDGFMRFVANLIKKMTDKRRLVFSMLKFLTSEMESKDLSDDAKESLEVASQCLQSAYALTLEDKHLTVSKSLDEIFKTATASEPLHKTGPPSAADKEEAERLKTEGNNLMRTEKFPDALLMYSKAIDLDGSNPVFYCNRAAAHSKMNNHHLAIEDCQRAVDMDSNYSKAYGRMGLAYSSLDKHKEAVDNFKKALELEPDNESYKSNLQIAEDKLQTMGSPGGAAGFPAGLGGLAGPGGMDLGSFLNNPALMNMATTMLQDPNMQNMMSQMMGGMGGGAGGMGGAPPQNIESLLQAGMGGGAPGAPGGGMPGMPGAPPQNIESLLQAGQQLAQQMQASNPELVEQLRRQMMGGNPPPGQGGNGQPPL